MSLNITKTGIFKGQIVEPFLTLADGSKWKLMLYHYIDKGNNLFTTSNATYCNDLGLYSRLININDFKYDNKYEFYVIQDGKIFRWTQTSQPTASSISGRTDIVGTPVYGLAKNTSQSNSYLGYSTWWGACGCWTSYSTGGATGIPGFGGSNANGIAQYYLALYTRIEDFNAFAEDKIISGQNIYEY